MISGKCGFRITAIAPDSGFTRPIRVPINHRIAANGSSLAIALAARCRFAGNADDCRCRLGPGASAFFARRLSALKGDPDWGKIIDESFLPDDLKRK